MAKTQAERSKAYYEKHKEQIKKKRKVEKVEKENFIDEENNEIKIIKSRLVNPSTKQNYLNYYYKITNALQSKILEVGPEEIIKVVDGLSESAGSKLAYLNIPIILYSYFERPDLLKLENFRQDLFDKRDIETNKYLKLKDEELPSFIELKKHLHELLLKKDYRKYIINYLLINYGVRNKDLDVEIVDKKHKLEDDKNYLVIFKNSVRWVINDYKTLKAYGQKIINIRSKVFLNALISLNTKHLLEYQDGRHVPEYSVGIYIPKMTYKNLTEADYFKIIMKHIKSENNFKNNLHKYSESRGSNILTIINNYFTS